jgi:hypothetical protein
VINKVTPELKERVRGITEDPNSGGRPPLTRSKNDYLIGSLLLWGLTERVMLHLGYKREDYGEEIRKELEPVVFAAMRRYAERRGGPQVRIDVNAIRTGEGLEYRPRVVCDYCGVQVKRTREGHVFCAGGTPKGIYFTHTGCYIPLVEELFGGKTNTGRFAGLQAPTGPNSYTPIPGGFTQNLADYLVDVAADASRPGI